MHFIKEAEYKYIIKEKSYDEKSKEFFECFISFGEQIKRYTHNISGLFIN